MSAPTPAPASASGSSPRSSSTTSASSLNLFFPNQYPREYHHTVVQNEADVPVKTFMPFTNSVGIIPVFRRKAWRNVSQNYLGTGWISSSWMRLPQNDYTVDFYDRLAPALQLASILVSRARPFFVHLYRGNVIQNGSDIYLDCNNMPRPIDEFAYDNFMQTFPQDLMFTSIPARPAVDGKIINGNTMHLKDMDAAGAMRYQIPIVGIAAELLNDITSNDFLTRPQAHREAAHFNLAQLLLHEFAHALWYARNDEDKYLYPAFLPYAPFRPEPIIPPSTFSEVGFITAIVVFGCQPALGWPVGSPEPARDGSAGMRALYLHKDNWSLSVFTRIFSAETIHSLFSLLTWQPLPDGTLPVLDIHLLEVTVPENSGQQQTGLHVNTAPNVPAPAPVVIQPAAPPTPTGPAGSAANPVILP